MINKYLQLPVVKVISENLITEKDNAMNAEKVLASSAEFYFYKESGNDDQICLKLFGDIDFEASSKSVMVKIPVAVWEGIRQIAAIKFDLVDKTDVELREIVESEVDENSAHRERRQLEKSKKGDRNSNHFTIIRSLVYASSNEPREQQIENGLNHYRKKRLFQQETLEKMKKFWIAEAI